MHVEQRYHEETWIYQQDGAPPHYALTSLEGGVLSNGSRDHSI